MSETCVDECSTPWSSPAATSPAVASPALALCVRGVMMRIAVFGSRTDLQLLAVCRAALLDGCVASLRVVDTWICGSWLSVLLCIVCCGLAALGCLPSVMHCVRSCSSWLSAVSGCAQSGAVLQLLAVCRLISAESGTVSQLLAVCRLYVALCLRRSCSSRLSAC